MTASSFFRPFYKSQQDDAISYENTPYSQMQPSNSVIKLLDLKPGERVLELGYADGFLTQKLVSQSAEAVGFEISTYNLEDNNSRKLKVKLDSTKELYFHQDLDAVFSHDALHWMRNSDEVARCAFMSLKPGGCFFGEFAGAKNAILIRRAIYHALERRSVDAQKIDPWYLPTAYEYQQVLELAGFQVTFISWFEQPMVLNYSISEWIRKYCNSYLVALPIDARALFLREVEEELIGDLLNSCGQWELDCTRLRFRAKKAFEPYSKM